jgi:hypothetical protein
MLTLANSSLSSLAYAQMTFDPPISGLGRTLQFDVRGQQGGETLELIFKDIDNNSSLNWQKLIVEPEGLTTGWTTAEIRLEASNYFNADSLREMRIEIGTQRTKNPESAVVFIRNMRWILDPEKSA